MIAEVSDLSQCLMLKAVLIHSPTKNPISQTINKSVVSFMYNCCHDKGITVW